MVAFLYGCGGRSADELFNEGERASHNAAAYSKAEALLKEFLKRFPEDARCDVALIALARIFQNQDRPQEAVAAYQQVLARYPDSQRADEAQFMVGYIHDSARDYEKARVAYQNVIQKYPHSEFVDDARASLEHLGKSPEQWLAETQQETVAVKK
ncbi:tetratricopeptide repeat protein [bacterium]|nr:tetratricopeptide repeat protein [bacterium]